MKMNFKVLRNVAPIQRLEYMDGGGDRIIVRPELSTEKDEVVGIWIGHSETHGTVYMPVDDARTFIEHLREIIE